MNFFLTNSRDERVIFFSGFLVAGVFILAYLFSGNASHSLEKIQSDGYLPLAVSIYENKAFTFSENLPYVPEATHVPMYPLFLAVIAVPFNSVIPALLLQAFIFAITAVILFRLFENVFSERVRFFAAIIFAVEPFTTFTIAQPLSEALFLFLFISSLYTCRLAIENKSFWNLFFSSILFSLAILTRPILLYVLPILVLIAVFFVYRTSTKRALTALIVSILGAFIVLMPWLYRNHKEFGVWELSTKGAYTLYFYDAALLLQYKEDLSASEASAKLFNLARATYPELQSTEDMRSPKYSSFMTKESIKIISQSPFEFAKMYAASTATFFLSDGYRLLWKEFSKSDKPLPNITRSITTGNIKVVGDYLQSNPIQATIMLFGVLFWSSVLILSFIAFISGFIKQNKIRFSVLLCMFFIMYFALLTGPVAQARYRIVATPFLFILASYGTSVVLQYIRCYRNRHGI